MRCVRSTTASAAVCTPWHCRRWHIQSLSSVIGGIIATRSDTLNGTRPLSYCLCYRRAMAQREKRSISLPPDLASAIDAAADAEGTTVSGWIADTARHRLRLDAGRKGIAEWERAQGALTSEELAEGLARARALLGRGRAAKRHAS